jgi:type IV fimbrial biogenesis protein FimT
MITLVIASIVLTMAVPGMRDLVQNNRITGQVNEMVTAFNLARMEAIRRGSPVSVCASTDQETCSPVATDWPEGWIVFADANATGNPANPAPAQRIRVWDQLPGNPTIIGASFVRYQSNGTTGAQFTFIHTIPDCSGMQKRTIRITPGGRVGGVTRSACP